MISERVFGVDHFKIIPGKSPLPDEMDPSVVTAGDCIHGIGTVIHIAKLKCPRHIAGPAANPAACDIAISKHVCLSVFYRFV